AWFQGTSMATPHVAAAAALVMSAGVTRPEAVEDALLATATGPGGEKYGAGVLDAGGAVRRVRVAFGAWRLALAALAFLLARFGLKRPRGLGAAGALLRVLAAARAVVLPLDLSSC